MGSSAATKDMTLNDLLAHVITIQKVQDGFDAYVLQHFTEDPKQYPDAVLEATTRRFVEAWHAARELERAAEAMTRFEANPLSDWLVEGNHLQFSDFTG